AREGQAAQEAATLEALPAARGAVQRTARGAAEPTARGVDAPMARGAAESTARWAAESTARGAAGPTAPAPAAASVEAADADADPLARVVGQVAGPGSPSSVQAWWRALRVATAGRWAPAQKAEAAPAPAPDDADAVRAPDGAVLGWLRFDGNGVTWQAATPGAPVNPWRAPVADAELRRQLQASRPR
ncbi:MAG: hypothetical protein ABIX12_08535, partial [Rubrivivax sp.]